MICQKLEEVVLDKETANIVIMSICQKCKGKNQFCPLEEKG